MAPKSKIALAFDVETTGNILPVCPLGVHDPDSLARGDALISVGWAGGRLAGNPPRIEYLAGPARLDIDLQKPKSSSWKDYWAEKGWSGGTFSAFWAERLPLLSATQGSDASSHASAALRLNETLEALEKKYEVVPIVDAVGFDDLWISVLLNSQGLPGLAKTREGRGRRVLDAYSFRLGRAGLDYTDAAPGHENGSDGAQEAFKAQRSGFPEEYEHPHLADRDAKGILAAYLSSLIVI